MPTLANLTGEVRSWLEGYSAHLDRATTTTGGLAASGAGTVVVSSAFGISPGFIEMDTELIYVQSVNQATNELTVPSWGRGQQGSNEQIHFAGAKVTIAPAWPETRIFSTINEVITGLGDQLFAVFVDETNVVDPVRYAYPLPAATRRVLSVRVKDFTIPGAWVEVHRWRLDYKADTADFPTGVAIEIQDYMPAGQTIKIVYAAEPQPLSGVPTQDFATATGLPASAAAAVALGTGAILIESLELTRLRQTTVEQQERSVSVLAGSATNASKYLYGLYQERLSRERAKLLTRYPPRIVKGW